MKTSFPLTTGQARPHAAVIWLATLALLLLSGASLRAGAPATTLHISRPEADAEGLSTFQLTWSASSNATYLVQTAANLAPGAWQTIDLVTPTASAGVLEIKGRSIPENSAVYFRLILPQPQIFSVEPAIVAPGVPVDLYVLGQCFPTNAEIRINGLPPGVPIYRSSSTLVQTNFILNVPGNYQVSLMISGQVVSSFTVVCADALANPELVLQGPPTEPPGSPTASFSKSYLERKLAKWSTTSSAFVAGGPDEDCDGIFLSKKGYDYYQARSDMASTGLQNNPAFQENPNSQGQMPEALIAAFLSKRGYDYWQAASARTFDVQDGKKGLNAVNVKLARTAGGIAGGAVAGIVVAAVIAALDADGGDCDDSDPIFMSAHKKFKGHVSLLKRSDNGGSAAARGGHTKSGHVSLLKRGDAGVSLFSGEVEDCVVDMVIPGRELDFVWARTYHSRIGRTGAAANGWTFSYDVSCAQNSSGGIDVFDGTGRKDTFTLGTNGVYTCPELFREGTISNNTFTLTFADTGRWVFNPFDGTATAGLVHQVITRNGSTITLSHNAANGRLTQIVDDLGRTNTVGYDTSGRLARLTDFLGRPVSYEYDGNGDLVACVSPPVVGTPNGNDFPGGKTNRYTYTSGYPLALGRQNHLLLSCVDAIGQTTMQFTYDLSASSASYLRCTAVQEGANPPTCFSFTGTPHVPVLPASLKCTVNDPVGNVSECSFDSRGRCVVARDYTGRATPGAPVTNVLTQLSGKVRSTDPDYYESQWTWNNDSLCTLEICPGGQQVCCVYQSDFDPATPARKRADCRVVREIASSPVDLDGDGVADTSERVCRYDYDPRFGSDPTSSALRESPSKASLGKTALRESPTRQSFDIRESPTLASLRESPTKQSLRESPTRASGLRESPTKQSLRESPTRASGLRESPSKASLGFCTSATDARGNVSTGSYDGNGNCTKSIRQGHYAVSNFHIEVDGLYNPNGQLTAITNAPDANGRRRVDTFAYSQGQMTECVIDAGAGGLAITSSFEYDAHGNLTRCVDPGTNDWLFTYNSLDQCVRAQSPVNISARCATDLAYDENDNLVSCTTEVRDAADNFVGMQVTRASYDSLHLITEVTLPLDKAHVQTNRFVYDGNGRCVRALGPDAVSGADPRQFTRYLYDERGLLFCTLQPSSASCTNGTDRTYNPDMTLARVSSTGNDCGIGTKEDDLIFAYDGFGRPASVTDAMGNQTVCCFDANDNLRVVRHFGETNDVPGSAGNVRLAETRCEYDSLDRLYKVHALHFGRTQAPIGDGEATTTFAYAANGDLASLTDDLGLMTTFEFDPAGRGCKTVKRTGHVTIMTSNITGRMASITETNLSSTGGAPLVLARTYAYDSQNRCVSSTDSAGNTTSCAYDSLGRVVRATDALGNDTTCAYDLLGNCLACVSYAGSSSGQPATVVRSRQAVYDTSSRCLATTDANTNTTSYAYDSMGRCTSVTRPDGTHEDLVWSPRSNLMQSTDPNGTVRVCTYDRNDRLVHCDISTGGGGAGGALYVEAFSYDGCDRLIGHRDDDCDGDFAYDSLGSCVRETLNGLATTSTYDALGNRLSLTYPGGRALTYAYDTSGRCASIRESGQALASFDYAGLDCVTRVTYGNGTRTLIGYDGLVGTPNPAGDHGFGQVNQVRHVLTASSTAFSGCKATWDQKQNKGARTVVIPGAGGRTNEMLFAYDALDQLVQSAVLDGTTVLRNTTYGFDPMGNRTNVTGAAFCSGPYTMDLLSPPADFQMNQYTTTPCDSRTYDNNGNLLSSSSTAGAMTFVYDYADRLVLVQAAVADGTGGITLIPVASYTYDALSRRTSKTVYSGGLPPSTRRYCYDGSCVIEERQNNEVVQSFVHASGLTDQIRENDTVVFEMRQGTQEYFFHTDDQGNVLALTSAQGSVVERYDYDDYGAVTFLTSDGAPTSGTSSGVGNPYCWGGLRLDAETGLQNDDGGGYFETQSGRSVNLADGESGVVSKHYITIPHDLPTRGPGNNPWSGGGGTEMKTGVVKFFNEAKGFGMVVGGSGKTHTKTGHVTLLK